MIHPSAFTDAADRAAALGRFGRFALWRNVAIRRSTRLAGAVLIAASADSLQAQGSSPAPDTARPPAGVQEREVEIGVGEWAVGGTLALPANARGVPAVVLMHGSGPGRRDGNVGPNRIGREIAWALAARGIAVLRYDKRTDVHADRFRALGRAATMEEEHTDDGVAAVRLLQGLPGVDRVYVLAGSQSTSIAADVARRAGNVAGLILAAVGGRPPLQMVVEQVTYGDSLDRARGETGGAARSQDLLRRARLMLAGQAPDTLTLLGKPVAYWASMDPQRSIRATADYLDSGGRVLVVAGGRDYLTGQADFDVWRSALQPSPRATFRMYPDLNHLMQPGVGRMTPAEYDMKLDISPQYLADLAAWVKE